jgi:hypothetical protein
MKGNTMTKQSKFLVAALALASLASEGAQANDNGNWPNYGRNRDDRDSCSGTYSIVAAGSPGTLVIRQRRGEDFVGTLTFRNGLAEHVQGECSMEWNRIKFFRAANGGQHYTGNVTRNGLGGLDLHGKFTSQGRLFDWSARSSDFDDPNPDHPRGCAGTYHLLASRSTGTMKIRQRWDDEFTGVILFDGPGVQPERITGRCSVEWGRIEFFRPGNGGQNYSGSVKRAGGGGLVLRGKFTHGGRLHDWRAVSR